MGIYIYDKSLTAAVMILAIITIRALALYKLPRRTFSILWAIVIIHLFVPFSVASPFNVYAGVNWLKQTMLGTKEVIVPVLANSLDRDNIMVLKMATDTPLASISMYMILWLAGMFVFAAYFFRTYLKCRREFAMSLPVPKECSAHWLNLYRTRRTVEIRQSDRIRSPLTYGVLRPVILLPKAMDWTDEAQMRYILAHEFVHIRRFDAVSKLVLVLTLSVHWFNPLIWVMVVLANRDIELSCDEAVIKGLGEHTRSAYAMTLIGMEENRGRLTFLFNHFSKNVMEERIESIMRIKKTTVAGIGLALAFIIGVPAVFAADAAAIPNHEAAGVTNESAITLSATDEDTGLISISEDGGVTWVQESEYQKNNPVIVWWTAEEYSKWLDQEKINLQSIVGAPGWSQERVDSAILRYEQELEQIKAGVKYSRTVDGDDNTSFVYTEGPIGISRIKDSNEN